MPPTHDSPFAALKLGFCSSEATSKQVLRTAQLDWPVQDKSPTLDSAVVVFHSWSNWQALIKRLSDSPPVFVNSEKLLDSCEWKWLIAYSSDSRDYAPTVGHFGSSISSILNCEHTFFHYFWVENCNIGVIWRIIQSQIQLVEQILKIFVYSRLNM